MQCDTRQPQAHRTEWAQICPTLQEYYELRGEAVFPGSVGLNDRQLSVVPTGRIYGSTFVG